jgi:hypothetical protein
MVKSLDRSARPFSGPLKFVLNFKGINYFYVSNYFVEYSEALLDFFDWWAQNPAKFKPWRILARKGVKHIVNKKIVTKTIVNKLN